MSRVQRWAIGGASRSGPTVVFGNCENQPLSAMKWSAVMMSPALWALRLWVSITRLLLNHRMPATPSARGTTATWVPLGGSHTKYCGSSFMRSQSEIIGENVKIKWSRVTSQSCIGPGLFDLAAVGGGDSVFALGVLTHIPTPSVTWLPRYRAQLGRAWSPALLDALDGWTARAAAWHGTGTAVAAHADVEKIEHGTVAQRNDNDRHHLLAGLDPDAHLSRTPDRAHRWTLAGLAWPPWRPASPGVLPREAGGRAARPARRGGPGGLSG